MFLKTVLSVVVVAVMVVVFPAEAQQGMDEKVTTTEKTESSEPDKVIKRGNKISNKSPVVTLEDIIKNPEKYEKDKVIIEATIDAVCQKKGCWMELVSGEGEQGIRVTFKDYGFFVPKDAAGLKVRAEGKVKVTTMSKADADHYEEEGAKIVRNADGTSTEIGFVAYGVELYKSK